jgi:hypothetical protein
VGLQQSRGRSSQEDFGSIVAFNFGPLSGMPGKGLSFFVAPFRRTAQLLVAQNSEPAQAFKPTTPILILQIFGGRQTV